MTNVINQYLASHSADEIASICKPLQKLGISYFGHANVDLAGRFSCINNNPAFIQHYFSNQYYDADIHHSKKVQFDHFKEVRVEVISKFLDASTILNLAKSSNQHFYSLFSEGP